MRLFDIITAGLFLLLAAPLLLLAALVVRLGSPGPIFYRQERIGKAERRFTILKLRTMSVNPDRELGQTYADDPELVPLGGILRRLKIDELPQLWNVLRGDMALVGPRPCLKQTLVDMPDWARRRFDVRPGMTGLAQVNGNIALTWPERWKHDVAYVERKNILTDMAILARTVGVVLLGEGQFRRPV